LRYFSAENVSFAESSDFLAICASFSDIRSRCSSSEGKIESWRLSASLCLFFLCLDRASACVEKTGETEAGRSASPMARDSS
jgi:hypothetical protein